jgi:hypothetical protein
MDASEIPLSSGYLSAEDPTRTVATVAGARPSSVNTRRKPVSSPQQRKIAPHSIGKKLPWLDGKGAWGISLKSPKGLDSDSETPALARRPTGGKTSMVDVSKRPNTSTPRVARKASVAPTERRLSSLPDSSPSPVTRHRQSQVRRASVAVKVPSPLGTASPRPTAGSHEPQRRLSVVHHHHDTEHTEEDHFGDVQSQIISRGGAPQTRVRQPPPAS